MEKLFVNISRSTLVTSLRSEVELEGELVVVVEVVSVEVCSFEGVLRVGRLTLMLKIDVPALSALEAAQKMKTTKLPPQSRTSTPRIPTTHSHVFEDLFG